MVAEPVSPANPYVGPRPFERGNANAFFGREAETDDLFSLIVARRVLLIYARSGAGKTSLINAGLLPRMEEEGLELLPPARVRGLIPDEMPFADVPNVYVMNTLISWAEDAVDVRELARLSLAEFLASRPRREDEFGYPALRVLIFDQFEELFTFYGERWRDREGFFEQVAAALAADPALRVVLAMREDYVARLDPYAGLLPDNLHTRCRLERLRAPEALQAITRPLAGTERYFAPGVAEKLVDELLQTRVEDPFGETVVVSGEYVEPVQLQVVCDHLWQELPPDVDEITVPHVELLGDVDDALERYYERSLRLASEASGVPIGSLRGWFENHLITASGTRGTVVRGPKETGGIPNRAVEALEDLHVIRGEWRAGARWYELTHDRLIGPLQQANEPWRLEQEALAQAHALAAAQAEADRQRQRAEVEARGRRRLALLAGVLGLVMLAALLAWQDSRASRARAEGAAQMAATAQAVAESREQEAQAEAASRATAEAVAQEQRQQAEAEAESRATAEAEARDAFNEREQAVRDLTAAQQLSNARELAMAALTNLDVDTERSLLLALQAAAWPQEDARPVPEVLEALHQGLRASRVLLRLPHDDVVQDVAYSPDGAKLATASWDNNAYIWDAASGELLHELAGHENDVWSVAFSPDGAQLATASYQAFTLWNAATGAELDTQPAAGEGWVYALTFHPDPAQPLLATAGDDGIVRIWSAVDGSPQRVISATAGIALHALAFTPDGALLAAAGDDFRIRIWDFASGRLQQTLAGHTSSVYALAFSADGATLFSGGRDKTARIWDVATGQEQAPITGHTSTIFDVALLGTSLVTASADGTVRVTGLGGMQQPLVLAGHGDNVRALALHPQQDRLATAGQDGTARTWQLGPPGEVAAWQPHRQRVNEMALSADGSLLATGGSDGYLALWDMVGGRELRALRGQTYEIYSVAFNGDYSRLASGSWAELLIHDTATGELLFRLPHEPAAYVSGAAFSEDGQRLVTGDGSGRIRLWDSASGALLRTFDGSHDGGIRGIVFRRGDAEIVSVGYEGSLRIWDPRGGSLLEQQSLCSARPTDPLASNTDASLFILGDPENGDVRLCEPATGAITALPEAQEAGLWGVGLSAEGDYFLTFREDGLVRQWDLQTHALVRTLDVGRPFLSGYISDDAQTLILSDVDGTINVWDLPAGVSRFEAHLPPVPANDAAYLGEDQVLTVGDDAFARVWSAEDGSHVATMSRNGHYWDVQAAALSPDGQLVATAGIDWMVKFWDAATGAPYDAGSGDTYTYTGALSDVAWNPVQPLVAAAGASGRVPVWDLATGELVKELEGDDTSAWAVAFSPDGALLATAGQSGEITLWETAGWTVAGVLPSGPEGHSDLVFALAFSPDGSRLVSGSRDWDAIVWEVDGGSPLVRLQGHTGAIAAVAFSPDARQVATGSWDRSAWLWDVETGEVQQRVAFHEGEVTSVDFSPDGRHLLTASSDGTVRIQALTLDELIALARDRVTRALTAEECRRFLHQNSCPAP